MGLVATLVAAKAMAPKIMGVAKAAAVAVAMRIPSYFRWMFAWVPLVLLGRGGNSLYTTNMMMISVMNLMLYKPKHDSADFLDCYGLEKLRR
mmetsp:Transcript_30075/g.60164  ORF Transcript_30075/g.60164 Transcript_30075/m.60164 type:complete len:92 (-) Transcript_30075:59-334(-)